MKLTQYSDYSLRVLIYLGLQGGNRATINDIADAYGISRHHIVKIVHKLGQLGYVDTVRGKNGGMHLAYPPEQIKVGQVVRHMEFNMGLAECFVDQDACVLTPVCVLRGALGDALGAFLNVLDEYTLADLLAPREQLQERLFFRTAPVDA